MTHLNWRGVVTGGLTAGLVIFLFEFVQGLFLGHQWAASIRALGKSTDLGPAQSVVMVLWSLAIGYSIVWLYGSLHRHRMTTALCAGSFVWAVGYLFAMVAPLTLDLIPVRLIAIALAAGLVETLAAAMAGAIIYHQTAPWSEKHGTLAAQPH
jgi:hypothetical protein